MNLKEIIACLNDPIAIKKAAKEAREIAIVAEAQSIASINAMNNEISLSLGRYRPERSHYGN